jgi:hypothetical protein
MIDSLRRAAMAASLARQEPELLTSWKEIASYLGKGVRTVQRWEQQFGLPVRRPNEKSKGIVHATAEELDAWLATQWSQRPKEFAQAIGIKNVYVDAMRASVKQAMELRHANQLLLQDVRSTLASLHEQCRLLARNLPGTASTLTKRTNIGS